MKGTSCICHTTLSFPSRIVCIVAFTGICCLLVSPVTAHPPTDMSISYNGLSRELRVTVTHPVPDPQAHYIHEVRVTIHGATVNDSTYTSQPGADTFTYTYPVATKPGDEIKVTASCVLAGSISRNMHVPKTTAPSITQPDSPPATQKAAAGIIPLLGLVVLVLLRRTG